MLAVYYTLSGQRYKVERPQTEDDLQRLRDAAYNNNIRLKATKVQQAIYNLFNEIKEDFGSTFFVVVGQKVIEVDKRGKPYDWQNRTYEDYLAFKTVYGKKE